MLFLEIDIVDPSDFSDVLRVRGVEVGGHRILRVASPAAPNAIAAVLLALRDATGVRPHVLLRVVRGLARWHTCCATCSSAAATPPPVVREIIRKVEPDPDRRPGIHVS